MIKVSVLVPICNVEKYLAECLESLVRQTLTDIEIICINDGSTDSSPQIIKKFAKKDPRIVVIDKLNSGYGDSMNQGIARAKGKYVAIVESDDFLEHDALEKMYKLARVHNAEIVRANYFYHTDAGDEVHRAIKNQTLDTPQTILDDTAILYEEPAIWSAIYLRSFLNRHDIRFLPTPGASYQDTSFNFKALASAERIVYTDQPFLHYRTDNSGSSMKSLEKADYVRVEYEEIEKYLDKIESDDVVKYVAQAAKFGAFHWNLIRLPDDLALVFLYRMKEDFRAAGKQGKLKRKYFPIKYWIALQIILKLPVKVYYSVLSARQKH